MTNTYEERLARGDADPQHVKRIVEHVYEQPVTLWPASEQDNVREGIDSWAQLNASPTTGVRLQTKKRNGSYADLCAELFHTEPVVPGQPVVLTRTRPEKGYSLRAYFGIDKWELLVYQDSACVRACAREDHDAAIKRAIPTIVDACKQLEIAAPNARRLALSGGYTLIQAETPASARCAAFATYNIGIPWSTIKHWALPIAC